MARSLVSIIIPVYNGEAYIGEAIESALGQTYPHKEVIIIDDGSTDGSLDVITTFGDRVRWETGPNRGGSAARNRGLALARGELIQFLDADDLLHPQKLELQAPLVLEHPNAIVYCDYVVQELQTGRVLEIPRRECQGRDPVCFAVQAERLQTSAPIHRKKTLLEVGGFDESLPCCQEYDLHIRLACNGLGWYHMREVLYTVRQRPGSVSSDYARVLQHHPHIFRRAIVSLSSRNIETQLLRHTAAGKLCTGARHLLRYGKLLEAERLFSAAQEIHPSAGLDIAYSRPVRVIRRLLGAVWTERLVAWHRRLRYTKAAAGNEFIALKARP